MYRQILDGKSILPLLTQSKDEIHTHLPLINVWGPEKVHSFAVVNRSGKFVYWPYANEEFTPMTVTL